MFKKLLNEFRIFMDCPKNMRMLLQTNMTYAWVLPIVEVFIGAYIMRFSGSPWMVALYQLAQYFGVVTTSVVNGWLLKYFKVAHIYSAGMLILAFSMVGMMMITNLGPVELILIGYVMGAAAGFFWTNRYLVTLRSTDDENRNYFFGIESLGFTVGSICMPMIVGAVLAGIQGVVLFGVTIDITIAYRIVTVAAVLISVFACSNILRGTYENPEQSRFLYFKYHWLWQKMMSLAALKGMVQGFLVTAPAILVMKFLGEEGTLGTIQSVSGILTAILVYLLGRFTKPKHRTAVFAFGLTVFAIGTVANGVLFSATGAIVFILCKVIFQPLHDLAYFPIMLRTIDVVSKLEERNEYTYIMTHEVGMFIGRALGLTLFLGLAFASGDDFALKYALPIVGLLQMLSLPLAKNIQKDCEARAAGLGLSQPAAEGEA